MTPKSSYYAGKLYTKESIQSWNLPLICCEQVNIDAYPYFFLTCIKDEEREKKDVHLTMYPTNNDNVYYLEIRMERIFPEILHKVLSLLREKQFEIMTSTGVCHKDEYCNFGVFYSESTQSDMRIIQKQFSEMDKVLQVKILKYDIHGCCEL